MKLKIPNAVLKVVGRPMLQVQAHSPEILLVAGVGGVVTAAVLACKATLKLEDVLSEAEKKSAQIEELEVADYTASDKVQDQRILKVVTARKIVQLYGPSVGLGLLSIGCLVGSHRIMSTRNAALVAAYTSLEKSFSKYRERVQNEVGPEKERDLRYGDEKEIAEIREQIKSPVSVYARFFDENSVNWNRNPGYNQMFISTQQQYANDRLRAKGHVFLNEVYDMLGLERTPAGQIVGWVKGNGDDYIDFGVFDGDDYTAMRFVQGDEPSILLDFNVDGVVYNLI